MVVCQFFLRGACKFGNSCRNEHVYPMDSSSGRNSPAIATSFGTASQGGAINEGVIQEMIKLDMAEAPLWPFSCYGLPGVRDAILTGDISPEEIMLETRRMKSMNMLEPFFRELMTKIQEALAKRAPVGSTTPAPPPASLSTNPFQVPTQFPSNPQTMSNNTMQNFSFGQGPSSAVNPFSSNSSVPSASQPFPPSNQNMTGMSMQSTSFGLQKNASAFPSNVSSLASAPINPTSAFNPSSLLQPNPPVGQTQLQQQAAFPSIGTLGWSQPPQSQPEPPHPSVHLNQIPIHGPLSGDLPGLSQAQQSAYSLSTFEPCKIPEIPPR